MDIWKKCFQAFMDFIEIYMPMCWFVLLFVAFILQIISRYIFNTVSYTHLRRGRNGGVN